MMSPKDYIPRYLWALTIALMLVLGLLLPTAGFMYGTRVRQLINDDVSRLHARTAASAGFRISMAMALGLFVPPAAAALTSSDAIYLVVTPATGGALLHFAWLEWRAHRDG